MAELAQFTPGSNGIVAYVGPSQLDQAPIVMVATLHSNNAKTGDMIQTWILRSDMNPLQALSTGADVSICGTCVHRGPSDNGKSRSCYVNVHQAPLNIYRTYLRGKYTPIDSLNGRLDWLSGRMLRCGAYGDPAAIPYELWSRLVQASSGHTGYTHQWKTCDQRFNQLLMASCDSEEERLEAKSKGWRTFRVHSGEPLMTGEFSCPASEEAGKKRTCEECLACGGTRFGLLPKRAGDVAIAVHGSKPKLNAWRKNQVNTATERERSSADIPKERILSSELLGSSAGVPTPPAPASV